VNPRESGRAATVSAFLNPLQPDGEMSKRAQFLRSLWSTP